MRMIFMHLPDVIFSSQSNFFNAFQKLDFLSSLYNFTENFTVDLEKFNSNNSYFRNIIFANRNIFNSSVKNILFYEKDFEKISFLNLIDKKFLNSNSFQYYNDWFERYLATDELLMEKRADYETAVDFSEIISAKFFLLKKHFFLKNQLEIFTGEKLISDLKKITEYFTPYEVPEKNTLIILKNWVLQTILHLPTEFYIIFLNIHEYERLKFFYEKNKYLITYDFLVLLSICKRFAQKLNIPFSSESFHSMNFELQYCLTDIFKKYIILIFTEEKIKNFDELTGEKLKNAKKYFLEYFEILNYFIRNNYEKRELLAEKVNGQIVFKEIFFLKNGEFKSKNYANIFTEEILKNFSIQFDILYFFNYDFKIPSCLKILFHSYFFFNEYKFSIIDDLIFSLKKYTHDLMHQNSVEKKEAVLGGREFIQYIKGMADLDYQIFSIAFEFIDLFFNSKKINSALIGAPHVIPLHDIALYSILLKKYILPAVQSNFKNQKYHLLKILEQYNFTMENLTEDLLMTVSHFTTDVIAKVYQSSHAISLLTGDINKLTVDDFINCFLLVDYDFLAVFFLSRRDRHFDDNLFHFLKKTCNDNQRNISAVAVKLELFINNFNSRIKQIAAYGRHIESCEEILRSLR